VTRTWMKQAERQEGKRPGGLSTDEREELHRENQTLPIEREILKKAAAFFAWETGDGGGGIRTRDLRVMSGVRERSTASICSNGGPWRALRSLSFAQFGTSFGTRPSRADGKAKGPVRLLTRGRAGSRPQPNAS
jgi:hypothetical protein